MAEDASEVSFGRCQIWGREVEGEERCGEGDGGRGVMWCEERIYNLFSFLRVADSGTNG